MGFLNPTHYLLSGQAPADFHDITVGNVTFGTITGRNAEPGWDANTGVTTPDVAQLVPDIVTYYTGNNGNNNY